MPEGHSIRRAADQWADRMGGQILALSSPQNRFTEEAAFLDGRRLVATDAHGKHLFLEFEGEQFIHVHLGLYGRFTWHRNEAPEPRPTVRLRAVGESRTADLSGPTRCEVVDGLGKARIHERLGPDPLHPDDTLEPLQGWLSQSLWPIGRTVMDQSKIAGIGNVYRAELLFMLGMSPWRPTMELGPDDWRQLWALARALLEDGTRRGRIVTTGADLPPAATLPPGTHCATKSYVYKRTGRKCLACRTPIRSEEFYGRTLYWCPTCQAE